MCIGSDLNVELEVVVESVGLEERDDCLRIVVVLVFGGFLRFGLDEQLPLESDGLLVRDGHSKERRHVIQLTLGVRVEQRGVAFSASPKHEV